MGETFFGNLFISYSISYVHNCGKTERRVGTYENEFFSPLKEIVVVVVAFRILVSFNFCLLLYSFFFRSLCIMSDMKRLFYVWFLGAKECRGLRGDEFVRPIVRYVHFLFVLSHSSAWCYSNFSASNYQSSISTHHGPFKALITSCLSFFSTLIRLGFLPYPSYPCSRRNNNKTNDQSPFLSTS